MDTKKNLSQIEKLAAVAAMACEFNHATQRMPNRGCRVIANDMNASENVPGAFGMNISVIFLMWSII